MSARFYKQNTNWYLNLIYKPDPSSPDSPHHHPQNHHFNLLKTQQKNQNFIKIKLKKHFLVINMKANLIFMNLKGKKQIRKLINKIINEFLTFLTKNKKKNTKYFFLFIIKKYYLDIWIYKHNHSHKKLFFLLDLLFFSSNLWKKILARRKGECM